MKDNINKDKINQNNINEDKSLPPEGIDNSELVTELDNIINESLEVTAEDLDEIEAIQEAIEEGEEPIEDIETAAGNNGGGGFTVVDVSRDGSETLATTDFETASFTLSTPLETFTDTNGGQ